MDLIRVGRRAFNLEYLLWYEDDNQTIEVGFVGGRVFRLDGLDAMAWREAIRPYIEPPERRLEVSHGRSAVVPGPGGTG